MKASALASSPIWFSSYLMAMEWSAPCQRSDIHDDGPTPVRIKPSFFEFVHILCYHLLEVGFWLLVRLWFTILAHGSNEWNWGDNTQPSVITMTSNGLILPPLLVWSLQ